MVELTPIGDAEEILKEVQDNQKRQDEIRSQAATSATKQSPHKIQSPVVAPTAVREKRFLERDTMTKFDDDEPKGRLPFISYFLSCVYFIAAIVLGIMFFQYDSSYMDALTSASGADATLLLDTMLLIGVGAFICVLMVLSIMSGRNGLRQFALLLAIMAFVFGAIYTIDSLGNLQAMNGTISNPLWRIVNYLILSPVILIYVLPIVTIFHLQKDDTKRYYK